MKYKDIDISADMNRLRKEIKTVPDSRLGLANTLFDELVFMAATLDKLKAQINSEGVTTMFQQGAQCFLKEHPALKSYNTTIQRFCLVAKQLNDLIPAAAVNIDELDKFINDREI